VETVSGFELTMMRLESLFLEGESGMDTAVVELDALANPVGATAQDHDLAPVRTSGLVVATVVGGVIIGRVRLELGGAGVHQTVAGHQAEPQAFGAHGILRPAGQVRDLAVGKAEGLGAGEKFRIELTMHGGDAWGDSA
jgi:hypothetical protein